MQQRLRIDEVEAELVRTPRHFLVTGGAGFIGSHLVERLLQWGQRVRVVDNFATGKRANLPPSNSRFELIEGSVDDLATMTRACAGVDVVLHQAALGSVPRSIKDPLPTHRANVDGFAITVLAAHAADVKRVVYASSSSVYGDEPNLPKREDRIGRPLSPYAASKRVDEILGGAYADAYGMGIVGLRYFNVFGPRQDPQGQYAAVIPRFVHAMLEGRACTIHGDGATSRDFCFIDNVVQANLLAALMPHRPGAPCYNIACGAQTTLLELHTLLADAVRKYVPGLAVAAPDFADFRAGDVRHSLADITRAREELGYVPQWSAQPGLDATVQYTVAQLAEKRAS